MNLLVLLIALPLLGALVVALLPRQSGDRLAVPLGVVVSGATLAVAVALFAAFDYGRTQLIQERVDASWAPAIDLRARLGVDGISLPLVGLTALLAFLCLLYSLRHLPAPG
ncbi:MAG TPA: NADH-quinone oxidoreductase subunit M, partial [Mycobacteriales bacterium]|nr:NADH-quinone oxidoreductase subunit M [Mycobacteriales bacterium]